MRKAKPVGSIVIFYTDTARNEMASSLFTSKDPYCFSCQQLGVRTTATRLCAACDVTFCDRCGDMHRAMPGMSGHMTETLSHGDQYIQSSKSLCYEHNSYVEFCCRDCNETACQTCCIVYHRSCQLVVTIDSMIPEITEVLQQNMNRLKKNAHETESVLALQEARLEAIRLNKASVQQEIRGVSQQAVAVVQRKDKQLMDELEKLIEHQNDPIRKEIESEKATMQMYQQHAEVIETTLSSGCQMDLYDMYQNCQSGEFETVTKVKSAAPSVRKVAFVKEFDGGKWENDIPLGHIRVSGQDFVLCRTVDATAKNDTKVPDLCDLVVLNVDGLETLVVTDINNQCLKSCYTKQSTPCCSTLKLSINPLCVTKLRNNQVVVSFQLHCGFIIVHITPDPVLLSTVSTLKNYRCFTAIGLSRLAAGYNDPPGIDIITLSGKVVETITKGKICQKLIQEPSFMSTTNNGNILVSDEVAGTVVCLTTKGNVIFTYGQNDVTLTRPQGVICHQGSILVADYDNNKVVQLSENGKLLREVLTSRDGVKQIQGIFSYGKKLYVTQYESTLKVFTPMA